MDDLPRRLQCQRLVDRSFRFDAARVLGFRVLRSSNPTCSFHTSEVATASKPKVEVATGNSSWRNIAITPNTVPPGLHGFA